MSPVWTLCNYCVLCPLFYIYAFPFSCLKGQNYYSFLKTQKILHRALKNCIKRTLELRQTIELAKKSIFFCKIIAHFSFSPITLLIQTFGVCWLSPTLGFQWVEARGAARHLPMHKTPHNKELWSKCQQYQETLQTTFDMFSHSTFSIHCTNLVFHFNCIFTFLEILKHNTPKMFSSIFNINMAAQKFTDFDEIF